MQLRVVGDYPWDVPADVLAVPYIGEPQFQGALAELDKRAGGELAALAAFGELKAERYSTVITAADVNSARRVLISKAAMSFGPTGRTTTWSRKKGSSTTCAAHRR